jgi:hypothetical protein
MKTIVRSYLLLCMTTFVMSCTSRIVSHSDKDKDADMKQYKTYAWTKPGDEEYHVTYDKKEAIGFIIDLSNVELKNKGFIHQPENPDAVFLVDTSLEDRIAYGRTSPYANQGFGVGAPMYYGGSYGGFYGGVYGGFAPISGGPMVETEFQQGLLFVEMYDAKTKKLVWRGWAEDQITNKTNLDRDIRKAVSKIFGHLPVTHK